LTREVEVEVGLVKGPAFFIAKMGSKVRPPPQSTLSKISYPLNFTYFMDV